MKKVKLNISTVPPARLVGIGYSYSKAEVGGPIVGSISYPEGKKNLLQKAVQLRELAKHR